ncbi:hypothetical protein [Chitinophaga caseinilytica]|uniref:DUF4292 domain-containing protein n=1 Tax=Chitinophaga caseinilytica TaxID=2267521 RepID=A0ABZ2Z2Y2_9BACT
MLKKILIILVCSVASASLHAQRADTAKLFSEMRKLHAAYSASGLRYDFRYTYAAAGRPEQVLDSLSGSVEMSAAGLRMVMANMEFVSNPRYAIVLFKEDKVMYLYKPNGLPPADPLSQVRALMETGLVKKVDISQEERNRRISIAFDSLAGVKSIDLNIQPANGLLSSARYLLQTEMMKSGRPLTEAERQQFGPLALVSMYFLRYVTLPADRAPFHESAYFVFSNGEYLPTAAYSDYQIYKGSPNL